MFEVKEDNGCRNCRIQGYHIIRMTLQEKVQMGQHLLRDLWNAEGRKLQCKMTG